MNGIYRLSDTSPLTSTLTSMPLLVDGVIDVGHQYSWARTRAYGVDLETARPVEWIQVYGTIDSPTAVSWYPNANAFSVYKSDNNSAWTHVEDFVMADEAIVQVADYCAYFILHFSQSHTARYFKVIATGSSGAAWNPQGKSIKASELVISPAGEPGIQFNAAGRTSHARLSRKVETGSRFGLAGRSWDAILEPAFAQQFNLKVRSSRAVGRIIYPFQVRLDGQVRTGIAAGQTIVPCQVRWPSFAGSSTARLGAVFPTRLQPGALIRARQAAFQGHIPIGGQFITGLRSSPAQLDPIFAAFLGISARSTDLPASSATLPRPQLVTVIRSYAQGVHHIKDRQRLLYRLANQGRLLLNGGLAASGRQRLKACLTAGFGNRQRLRLSLTRTFQSRQGIIQKLASHSISSGRQRLKANLVDHDLEMMVPLDWDIFLDGISIKNKLIEPLTIIYDEAGIHNQLILESAHQDLFQAADPHQDRRHLLLVRFGTRDISFVLTGQSGNQDRFTLTGLSQSVILDHPYRTEMSFNQDYEVLAFRLGCHEINAGQVITGRLSGASALVIGVEVTAGSWDSGTAQGRLYIDDVQGDFLEEGMDTGLAGDAAFTDGRLTTTSLARTASEVARQMAGSPGLVWDPGLPDWVLPIDAQLAGYPIEIIAELARAVGGVIRCRDDGRLLVRPRFPVRPIHLPEHAPAAVYDRSLNIIQIDLREKTGTQLNAIEVNGYSKDMILPRFEFEVPEDNHFHPGQDLFARVFWAAEPPEENLARQWATAGQVDYFGRHTEQVRNEMVLLEQGRASVANPIYHLDHVTWVGAKGWGIEWTPYSREIQLAGADENKLSTLYRLAQITYATQYDRYRVKNHDVPALILAMEIPAPPAVAVKVKYPADSETPAQAIDAPLITTIEAAVFRGQAELDRSSYHAKTVQLLAPYNPEVTDGVVVEINDDHLGLQGHFHVQQAQIRIQGPMVLHQLVCIQLLV